jgi:hypothetical protein
MNPLQTILKRLLTQVVLLAFLAPGNAQKSAQIEKELPFNHGEELVYKVYYNWNFVWMPAGEITFKVWDAGSQLHYQAFGKTYSSYEWFYRVDDRYDSWVDRHSLLPNYSERDISEGKYRIFEKIAFNQSSHKMTVWRAPKQGEKETKTEHSSHSKVYDVLSTLYFLRTINFPARGEHSTEQFSIFMDQEEYPLTMKYLGKEYSKTIHGMGNFNVLKFQPEVIVGNVFKEDSKMTVWVADDNNRIPVLIESPVSVGSVKVVLKSYKGLKYNFEAKVK